MKIEARLWVWVPKALAVPLHHTPTPAANLVYFQVKGVADFVVWVWLMAAVRK